ncbi:MAG TPA: alpha/beta hydrolase-fold protein [Acidimicrobiales bacterium]|nr:alpha/beta hydrolase-fold protein [Acidimicrobiales bacterium]
MAPRPSLTDLARWGQVTAVAVVAGLVLLAVGGHLDRLTLDTPAIVWPLVLGTVVLVPVALARRSAIWWLRTLPLIASSAAVVVGSIAWYVRASGTITDAYPPSFLLWFAMAIVTVAGVVVGWRRAGPGQRLAGLLAAPVAVATAFVLINAHYGYWPTLGDLLGHPLTGQISADTLHREMSQPLRPRPAPDDAHAGRNGDARGDARGESALSPVGRRVPPGQFVMVPIPGTMSGFHARDAGVYLPPAYFTTARPELPVLVFLAGTPSNTNTLAVAGGALATANRFAATHDGLAPIMIFPDENGSLTGDTECVNGPRGQAETYLTVDVRDWVTQYLHATSDPRRWALVGFSEGGTCALDLSLRHAGEFPTFVDLAGDSMPNLAHDTLGALYGGDGPLDLHHQPLWIMTHYRYPGTVGWFGAGHHDPFHLEIAKAQARLGAEAGMQTTWFEGPYGHDFKFCTYAIRLLFPQLFAHLDLGGSAAAI